MDLTSIQTWIAANKLTAIAIGVAIAGGAAYLIMKTGSSSKQVTSSSVKGLLGTHRKVRHHHPRIKILELKK